MAVLLADRSIGVRRRVPAAPDGHGDRAPGVLGPPAGPWPGRAEEGADVPPGELSGRTWVLALDPAAWPLTQGDVAYDADTGEEWYVTSADLRTNNADPAVDYVRAEAHRHGEAGTSP